MNNTSKGGKNNNDYTKYVFNNSSNGNKTCVFYPSALDQPLDDVPWKLVNMSFKLLNVDSKLVLTLLANHGFREVNSDSNDFNLLWSNNHINTNIISSLRSYQRINHFPRSCELTRKDKLYKNIETMSHRNGIKKFSFVPETYIMPKDYNRFISNQYRHRGLWIVKPFDLSRGRGITIIDYSFKDTQSALKENVVVAKYIDNPLLVNGYKWDLRLYVLVTSFNPLVVYLYEEGLVRFATVKYVCDRSRINNRRMHLCNYSVNKSSPSYIRNSDPERENVGHKWSMSALLNHLREEYLINTETLMAEIEDIVVKTIMSATAQMLPAINCFVPHNQNCFELYGFDILVDDKLKPWLLEVNLSPSLGIDSGLDSRIKSSMLCDLFTLIGIPIVDPTVFNFNKNVRRPKSDIPRNRNSNININNLSSDEKRLLKNTMDQNQRSRGFIRIFPTYLSWKKYSSYLDNINGIPRGSTIPPFYVKLIRNYNYFLNDHLFSENSSFYMDISRQDRYERSLKDFKRSLNDDKDADQTTDMSKLKKTIVKYLNDGYVFSNLQARQTFALYLTYISALLKKCALEKNFDNPSSNLVLMFLIKASKNLSVPLKIEVSKSSLSNKKAMEILQLLESFLLKYNYDTVMYLTPETTKNCLPHKLFNLFLTHAGKEDIEEIINDSKHNCLASAIHPVNDIKNSKSLESKVWK
ncbi:tubulin polyglutamylase TTLL5 [Acyrthosiphon pisum]|uniref:Tubulin--tyrosine ligase-like protein 5 n=1 Tax=Acyrthosiphon pisum TaxID=7029 RepID=A0A8R2H9F3_ACYPI|nr:tubulin polyglutamylase TTLL5 [Acyrthosiphon pisum]|eukprot:XP_016662328.1 PREDICTED: tubulin polyglutamylase TTLL5 isoform X1 [Acyrthosiphon pisum]